MASVHNKIPLYLMLTGLPLIYKKEDATFAATKILDASGSGEGSYDISYDSTNGKWTIGLADLSEIKNHDSVGITETDIVTAIKDILGVTATADSGVITITGAEKLVQLMLPHLCLRNLRGNISQRKLLYHVQ